MVLAEMMIFAEMSVCWNGFSRNEYLPKWVFAEMVLAEMMIFAEMDICWNGFSRNDDIC